MAPIPAAAAADSPAAIGITALAPPLVDDVITGDGVDGIFVYLLPFITSSIDVVPSDNVSFISSKPEVVSVVTSVGNVGLFSVYPPVPEYPG